MDKFVIIDGNSLINRAFYALPLLTNTKGEYSNGVYGFANILIKAILEIKPKYIAVALDYGHKTFRNNIYADYKGKRKPTPPELLSQFPVLRKMLESMGIKYIEMEGIEADDIIGSLSAQFETENIIITGDRDCLQLINSHNNVWLTKKGITEVKMLDEKAFQEEYGLVPQQIVDLKALMGDSSDNIPGVAGIGEKTALALMQTYGSLDNIYASLSSIKPRQAGLLMDSKDNAYMSQTLARIVTDLDLKLTLKDFEYHFPFDSNVYSFFAQYEFNSLLKKPDLFQNISVEDKKQNYEANIIQIDSIEMLDKQIAYISKSKVLALDINNEKFCFAYDKNCEFVVPVQQTLTSSLSIDQVMSKLKPLLEDATVQKYCYDIKAIKHILSGFDINLCGETFDAYLAFYLLTVGERDTNRANLYSYLNMNDSIAAVNLFYAKDILTSSMQSSNLISLYNDIEFPLIDVLYTMEQTGFLIDQNTYYDLRARYQGEVKNIEQTIKNLAGHDFNVNSTKQLAEVLYDELGLITYNNKKRSTSSEYLEEMYNLHPIIPAIIRYRKVSKFLSTYVEPYMEVIENKDNLIHTVFNQTLTATGRLSSSKPNLQNIPVRDDEGRTLRKMFISRFKDGSLVSADYSQIELRLLAHASQDKNMIDAFCHNIDIHSMTASEIFDVPIQDVTSQMRRTAKATNFGIIYGISEFGLSQNINTSFKEAKLYIEKYFERYPKIKEYMENNVKNAKETGYAYTMFGRRRKIIELSSPAYMTRQFGERIAMNMPLQGTASDIIKLSMINVDRYIREHNLKSRLILQVHDELIVDCPREEVVEVAKMLKEVMENVVQLSVPLTVDVSSGKTWFDC